MDRDALQNALKNACVKYPDTVAETLTAYVQADISSVQLNLRLSALAQEWLSTTEATAGQK